MKPLGHHKLILRRAKMIRTNLKLIQFLQALPDVQLQTPRDSSFSSSSKPFSSPTSSIKSPIPAHKSLSEQNGVNSESCRTSDVRSKVSHHGTPTRPVLVRASSPVETANVKSPTRTKLKIEPAVRIRPPISEPQVKQHVAESGDQRLTVRPSASLMKADLSKLFAAFNAVVPHLPTFPFRALNLRNSSENELQVLGSESSAFVVLTRVDKAETEVCCFAGGHMDQRFNESLFCSLHLPSYLYHPRQNADLMGKNVTSVITVKGSDCRYGFDVSEQELLRLPPNDSRRLEGLRRHSAIFGRFDAPKRLTRPLRHFELCINKLTHWLVRHNAELVTQREHLFHIARQIVNITNYGMSSTQSGEIVWRMLDPDLLCKSTSEDCTMFPTMDETDVEPEKSEDEKSRYMKILNRLKTKMQGLVDEEETLRYQVRTFNKDEATVSQAQLKRQLERLVNRLHENLNQLAKYIVLYNSLPDEEQK